MLRDATGAPTTETELVVDDPLSMMTGVLNETFLVVPVHFARVAAHEPLQTPSQSSLDTETGPTEAVVADSTGNSKAAVWQAGAVTKELAGPALLETT